MIVQIKASFQFYLTLPETLRYLFTIRVMVLRSVTLLKKNLDSVLI